MASCSGSAVWRWLVFQSTTSQPPSGSAYTASMRPRTTWPASTRANGGSTALGTRSANGPDSNVEISSRSSSSSSMPRSPRPGRSSGSSSDCWPKRASTQAWKRVPKRAAGDGLRGIGLASSRANCSGSSRSRASAVADRLLGSGTSTTPIRSARASVSEPLELRVPLGDRRALHELSSSARVPVDSEVAIASRTSPAATSRRSCSSVRTGDGHATDGGSPAAGSESPPPAVAARRPAPLPSPPARPAPPAGTARARSGFCRVGLHWYAETHSSCLARVNATYPSRSSSSCLVVLGGGLELVDRRLVEAAQLGHVGGVAAQGRRQHPGHGRSTGSGRW